MVIFYRKLISLYYGQKERYTTVVIFLLSTRVGILILATLL